MGKKGCLRLAFDANKLGERACRRGGWGWRAPQKTPGVWYTLRVWYTHTKRGMAHMGAARERPVSMAVRPKRFARGMEEGSDVLGGPVVLYVLAPHREQRVCSIWVPVDISVAFFVGIAVLATCEPKASVVFWWGFWQTVLSLALVWLVHRRE